MPGTDSTSRRRAANWLYYDYEDFLKFPGLRPNDPAGEKAFLQTIDRACGELQELGVCGDLARKQQQLLGAVVVDLRDYWERFEAARWDEDLTEPSKLVGKRKLNRLLRLLGQLEREIETLPDLHPYVPALQLKHLLRAFRHELSGWVAPTRQAQEQLRTQLAEMYPPADPKNYATKRLWEFFAKECGLVRNEAEVRVAKIGNALLGWNVPYRERYAGADDWKGSTVIRQRVARYPRRKSRP